MGGRELIGWEGTLALAGLSVQGCGVDVFG
jgi:hypothetical protein